MFNYLNLSIGRLLVDSRYIQRAVDIADGFSQNQYSPADFDRFCDVIGEDGVIVLKLTAANSSEFVVRDVVCNMFAEFCGKNIGVSGGAANFPEDIEAAGIKKME